MKHQQWGLYVIAFAVLVVGLGALGVPASTLVFGAAVLACPLMMIFMMHGMHGSHGTSEGHGTTADPRASEGSRR